MAKFKTQAERVVMLLLAAAARFYALAPGVARIVVRDDDSGRTKTARVNADGLVLVSPSYLGSLSDKQALWVAGHELLHLLLGHHLRCNGRDADLWNQAIDMAIHNLMRAMAGTVGWEAPEGLLWAPSGMEEASAEEIYDHLAKQAKAQEQAQEQARKQEQDQEPDEGEGEDSADGNEPGEETDAEGDADGEAEDADEGEGDDEGQEAEGEGEGDGEGEGEDKGEGRGVGQGCGVEPGTGGSSEGTDGMTQRSWEDAGVQAGAVALDGGTGLGQTFAHAITPPPPKTPWDRVLRTGFATAQRAHGKEAQTWARRGRYSPDEGAQLPGWTGTLPRVAVIIDASGSVDDKALALAVSETIAVCKALDTRAYVVTHDVGVGFAGWVDRRTDPGTIFGAGMAQRGGTSFGPAYAAVSAAGKFDCVVHLTDGEGDGWPDLPRRTALVIALVGCCRASRNYLPPRARVIDTEMPR